MRNDNRRLLLGLFVAVVVIVAIGMWFSRARFRSDNVSAPQPVGTGGVVDVEKARERGAAVGETLAVATNKVTESAQEAATTAKVKAKMTLDDTARVLALVRVWAQDNPESYTSVWGSALDMAHAEVSSWDSSRWHVYVPEVAPTGLPMGLELLVDLAAGTCEVCDVE